MDYLTHRIAVRAMERLTRKAEVGELDHPEFRAKITDFAKPWVRARIAEGHDIEAIDKIAKRDELMVRRTIKLVHETYPLLFDDVIEEEISDLISSGEVVRYVGEDGELWLKWTGAD